MKRTIKGEVHKEQEAIKKLLQGSAMEKVDYPLLVKERQVMRMNITHLYEYLDGECAFVNR
jgi:hypothetical protein